MADLRRITKLAVTLRIDDEVIPVGTLAWPRSQRTAAFEFADGFAARGLPISPIHLKVGPGVRIAPPTPFGGLLGVFADSLPDGWGRLLLDRKIRALGCCRRAPLQNIQRAQKLMHRAAIPNQRPML